MINTPAEVVIKRVDAVLFDMDGVIVDSMCHHADSWIAVLREYGIALQDIDIFKREGMSGRDSIIDIFNEQGVGFPGDEEMAIMIQKKLAIFEKKKIELFPYIEELLHFLHGKSVPLALVTGSLRRSTEKLLPDNIARLFTAIVTADDVTRGKPHPEPYLTALHWIGCSADNTVVVENAPQGILSAKNAGMECYAIETTLPVQFLSGATKIFKDHCSLLNHFKWMLH